MHVSSTKRRWWRCMHTNHSQRRRYIFLLDKYFTERRSCYSMLDDLVAVRRVLDNHMGPSSVWRHRRQVRIRKILHSCCSPRWLSVSIGQGMMHSHISYYVPCRRSNFMLCHVVLLFVIVVHVGRFFNNSAATNWVKGPSVSWRTATEWRDGASPNLARRCQSFSHWIFGLAHNSRRLNISLGSWLIVGERTFEVHHRLPARFATERFVFVSQTGIALKAKLTVNWFFHVLECRVHF